jgi:hypothetical protein
MMRPLGASFALLLLAWLPIAQPGDRQPARRTFDPLEDSLARNTPQSVYTSDPEDPWNEVFFLLFTRTITSQVIADSAPVFAAGDERISLSGRHVTRIERGDRAIDPLYPSWLWMGSRSFDFEPGHHWRLLQEPRYSRLAAALDGVRRTATSRPPLARALMQADLWSVYDMLYEFTRPRTGPLRGGPDQVPRAEALLQLVANTLRALALSGEEIARLPDTYSTAASVLNLPDLLGRQNRWMEIRWFPFRSHDEAAGYRRAARVFLQPANWPNDAASFLNLFRSHHGSSLGALNSVALLIQLLLVTSDGTVVPSPITYEAQFRGAAALRGTDEIPQYELSRRTLLSSPATGGLVAYDANAPAYMPIAGNDFAFATPPRFDGEPVVAPLRARCSLCHSTPTGVGHLMTFSTKASPGALLPQVDRLVSAQNVHPRDVARRKMEREDFKSLRERWR